MTTTWGSVAGTMPDRGSASWSFTVAASTSVRSLRLMNPGPAISGGSHRSATCSRSTIRWAICRGWPPDCLANRKATFDWKCPNWGLVADRSSGSIPATAWMRWAN